MAQATSPDTTPRIDRLDPALDDLLAPDSVPMLLSSAFVFTEGPMWRRDRFWFVDEEADKIHAITLNGEVSTVLDYTQGPYAKPKDTPTASKYGATTGPNAMAPAPDGSVLAMQQYARDVVRLTESGPAADPVQQNLIWDRYDGKRLNSPNDVVYLPDASLFFSDPPYGVKDEDKELPFNAVFYVREGKLNPVIRDLTLPNGVALSPDFKTLYVNNSGPSQRVIAYALEADGGVGPAHDVIAFTGDEGPGVPDGLKVDSHGNLWTTGPGGIRIVTPGGRVLGQIRLPEVAANLAWGGPDGQTLLITARSHVYKLQTLVPGLMPVFNPAA